MRIGNTALKTSTATEIIVNEKEDLAADRVAAKEIIAIMITMEAKVTTDSKIVSATATITTTTKKRKKFPTIP